MLNFDNCEIILNETDYYPGQTLTGRVECKVDSSKKIHGIKIQYLGVAYVKWEEGHNERRRTFTAKEEYFNVEEYLVGSKNGEINLEEGLQTYSFSYALPSMLPPTFQTNSGNIKYTVKVTLDRPWMINSSTVKEFIVKEEYDLNLKPELNQGQNCEFFKTFWCWMCASACITCRVRIPFSGYVPGQKIEIKGYCDNPTKYVVKNIKLILEKRINFKATSPKKEKTQLSSISETGITTMGNFLEPFDSKEFQNSILVPNLPPTLQYCSIIDMEYRIKIELEVSTFHTNVNGEIPIIIGTVPLKNEILGFESEHLDPYGTSDLFSNTYQNDFSKF